MIALPFPDLRRVQDDDGSHIEPPLDQSWSPLEKLRWNAAVVRTDSGCFIEVTESDERPGRFSLQVGGGSMGGFTFDDCWLFMVAIGIGAGAVRREVAS